MNLSVKELLKLPTVTSRGWGEVSIIATLLSQSRRPALQQELGLVPWPLKQPPQIYDSVKMLLYTVLKREYKLKHTSARPLVCPPVLSPWMFAAAVRKNLYYLWIQVICNDNGLPGSLLLSGLYFKIASARQNVCPFPGLANSGWSIGKVCSISRCSPGSTLVYHHSFMSNFALRTFVKALKRW